MTTTKTQHELEQMYSDLLGGAGFLETETEHLYELSEYFQAYLLTLTKRIDQLEAVIKQMTVKPRRKIKVKTQKKHRPVGVRT